MPKEAEPIQQSSQTELEISQIVEKARRRRQQQNERRRSMGGGGGGGTRLVSSRSLDQKPENRAPRNADAGETGLAPLEEEGITELNSKSRAAAVKSRCPCCCRQEAL